MITADTTHPGGRRPAPPQIVCHFCRRRIFKGRENDVWYHDHNASTKCRLGWSSNNAIPLTIGARP